MAADVTAGVIRGPDGCVLIAERFRACPGGGTWEFPGGTREEGETLEDCLHRELKEELGIRVRIDALLAVIQNPYAEMEMTLHAFLCTHVSGEPQRIEVKDWKWVTLGELRAVHLTGADRSILEALETQMGRLP